MKTTKNVLSLILALTITLSLCACGADSGVTKAELNRMIEDVYTTAYTEGYSEGQSDSQKESLMQHAEDFICDCPSCTNSGADAENTFTADESENIKNELEVVREEHLPILMNYIGTWLDQNGDPMSYADAELFFKRNREYAKVAVAVNSLCEELQSAAYQHSLETVYGWATASPHDTDEYLAYEWLLSETEINYDSYLSELLALIGDQIDLNSSPAANIATSIILEKMLEFRDDGTYEAAINPHRKHDCEAEGCNTTPDATVVSLPNPALANVPVVSDILELKLADTSDAEITAQLDEQNQGPVTQFDLQHPNLYFDSLGRAHGGNGPIDEYYYATSDGKVYKLDNSTDIERIGESPLFDASLRGTYVGETTRIIK